MNAIPKPYEPSQGAWRDWATYIVLAVLYVPIIFPILRANRYYEDDLGRSLIGRQGWDATGRPLTTFIMRVTQCYDRAMVDISPFTQIAAVAILAWLGVLMARRFEIRSPWIAALVAFPLGAQPFFLENLSYKFDALSMALALFFAMLPILYAGQDRGRWWLGMGWLLVSLGLYQAAITAYLLFILLELQVAMVRLDPPSSLWRHFLSRAAQAFAATLMYQLLIGMPMINGWVKRHSQKIHSMEELGRVPANLAAFYGYIGDSFNRQWWMYFLPLLGVLALVPVLIGMRYAWSLYQRRQRWSAAGAMLASIALPPLALLCVMGPMLTLVTPFLAARVMMGVGAWLSVGLVALYVAVGAWRRSARWVLAAAGMLAVGMMVIANAYGNAQFAQARYEAHIATRLADDYAALKGGAGATALLLDGTAGFAPATRHAMRQFPLIGRLISSYLAAPDNHHTAQYLAYYMPGAAYILHPAAGSDPARAVVIQALLSGTCGLKPLRYADAYEMYVVNGVAVAIFHQQSARQCDGSAISPPDDAAAAASLLDSPI